MSRKPPERRVVKCAGREFALLIYSEHEGLAVTRVEDEYVYSVTHLKSSMRIGPSMRYRTTAQRRLDALLPLTDWTASGRAVLKQVDRAAVQRVIEATK